MRGDLPTMLVLNLIKQLADLTARVDAMKKVIERHGISGDEIDRVAQELRAQHRNQLEEGADAAQKAAGAAAKREATPKYPVQ